MRLPHAERAIIPASKLRNYLLSRRHPLGMHKAAFFASLGYSRRTWRALRIALNEHALHGEVESVLDFAYGRKYVVRGIIRSPKRAAAMIVTVWVELSGESIPRLVTAYPEHA